MFSGTFLWQAIGEDAWHFSIDGVHMLQLESVSCLPLVVLFLLMLLYFGKNGNLNWGIWCMLLSFGTNWMGHYVLEVFYLPFASLISLTLFRMIAGCGLNVTKLR